MATDMTTTFVTFFTREDEFLHTPQYVCVKNSEHR